MSKPIVHAESSARKWGGKAEDYLAIHQLMDSTKGTFGDNRHRCLTHNTWFIAPNGPLELIFGVTITNSNGRKVSVRDVGEQHILEDFGNKFIPSVQDYLQHMQMQDWMNNGRGTPPSATLMETPSTISAEELAEKLEQMKDAIRSFPTPPRPRGVID